MGCKKLLALEEIIISVLKNKYEYICLTNAEEMRYIFAFHLISPFIDFIWR
jgi:hypothetical protein